LLPFGDSSAPWEEQLVRKVLGVVCLALGAFLLMAAALGQFWAPGHAERTPLEVNTTTRLDGTAQKLDPVSGSVQDLRVKATSVTKSDSKHSDDDYIAFVSTTCLVIDKLDVPDCVTAKDPDKRLITASADTFATNRRTAVATNDPKYNAADATDHEGLINKFPFDVQKKTYPFWDGTLDQTVPATFKAIETVDGLDTYRFDVAVPPTAAEVVSGIQGEYSTDKSIWVEPRTGSIVKQTQHEVRTLNNGDPLLDLDIAYTGPTVKAAVDEAKSNAKSLRLLTQVVPIVGFVVGFPLLLAGLGLIVSGRRRSAAHVG
jgi:hypothetical protein